ncbi:MAG: DUF5110 domain-containing protein [Calditrichaeota bacterium]|nr:DUF5110 domain-containing protein [Calditrichota bacterium]
MIYLRTGVLIIFLMASGLFPRERSIQKMNDGMEIRQKTGTLKIQVCTDNILRVLYLPQGKLPSHKSLMVINNKLETDNWQMKESKESVSIVTAKIQAQVNLQNGSIRFFDHDGNMLLQEPKTDSRVLQPATIKGEKVFHIQENFLLAKDEAIYGLGQFQDGVMNYRGHDETLVQENTIAVVPFLLSSKNYGLLWDNYSMTKFHDGEDGTSIWSEVADAIDYYFIVGANFDQVIDGYRHLTGKAPMFGKWAYGYWQSKERYHTQDEIIDVVKEYRERKIPLDNIVQDWTYWGDLGWNAIDFDRKRFPDPAAMLKTIHHYNTHYMISIWPVFDAKTAVYKDMDAKGFIIHRDDGTSSRIYDAYNAKARALYWKWLNKNLFSIGTDAWWMDATEPEFPGKTPEEITNNAKHLQNNSLGSWARYLNSFSLMSTKGVYENQRKTTEKKRVYILTRSAYAGQQRYGAVTWSGDITATWKVLKTQIAAGLNFCMAGIPYWTTDIGAFHPNTPLGNKDEAYREIYVRWFQFGTFCPMFRSHGSGTAREVWQFGDKGYWAYDALVKFDNLRYRLLPYIYSLAWKVTDENYTIMRSLAFDFNDDAKVRNIGDQYMFGPAFLAAPVTERMYFKPTYVGDIIPAGQYFTAENKHGGLTAQFFNGVNFDTLVTKRMEAKIDFDWNDGSRPKEVHQYYYSIRFTGYIQSKEAGEYTFVTTSNDGIRLWIDDQLVINNWTGHGVTIDMGKITLAGHKKYKIKLEYFQLLGGSISRLAWITPEKARTLGQQKMPATKNRPVYLPKTSGWFDFWTGKSLNGGNTIQSPAPIDRMPLYVRTGSIVPMGPYLQYAAEKPADPIELRVYRGADGKFTLYEDENDNYNYEKGVFATIPFSWDDAAQTLTIGSRQGRFPGMLQGRTFRIVLVSEGHGNGIEPETQPDKIVKYFGKKIDVKF